MSALTLWVQILHRRGVLNTTLCDKVCQWLATGRWFSSGTPPLERYWVMGLEINSFLASTMHIPFPKSSQGIFYALEPWRFPSRAHTKWFVGLVHLWWLTPVLLISVISWRSVIVVVETGKTTDLPKSLTNLIKNVVLSTHHHERNSGSMLVVIGSDCIGR